MTKEQALAKGYVYEGMIGYVPVYLTGLNKFGDNMPGAAPKNAAWGVVLWVQEKVINLVRKVRGVESDQHDVYFGERLDGKPWAEGELE